MSSSQPPPPPTAEVLEMGGGEPLPPSPPTRRGRRRTLVAGASVIGAVGLGAAAYGAWWYLATGAQPAEALPASTLGYVSLDLDPSGSQKIDALRTLKKFPTLEKEFNLDGDPTDIDIKREVFEALEEDADCGFDYGADIEPWLGDRFAMAAVELGGEPVPVGVVQVSDGDAARAAVTKLAECDGPDGDAGTAVTGDWLILAETGEQADAVAAATEDEGSLADDRTFQARMEEAGDAGIVSLYAGPSAGDYLLELAQDGELADDGLPQDVPDDALTFFEEFGGAAAQVRFDGGALESDLVANLGDVDQQLFVPQGEGRGGDLVASLPASTMLAAGWDMPDGWFDAMLEYYATTAGQGVDDLIAEVEAELGLKLPEDLEALLGDAAALAVDSDLDVQKLFSASGPDELTLPVGLKVLSDSDDVEPVLDKLRAQLGPAGDMLVSAGGDGTVAIGTDEAYLGRLAEDGRLGDEELFRAVLPDADRASSLFFLDLDELTSTVLEGLESFDQMSGFEPAADEGADENQQVRENLDPLDAFGAASWAEDGVVHARFRLTTD